MKGEMKSTSIMAMLLACGGAEAAIVYDNTVNVQQFYMQSTDIEWGDTMSLAGAERNVTGFEAVIYKPGYVGPLTADLTARLYVGGAGGEAPGAMLWSDTLTNLTIADYSNIYRFVVPEVLVPDDVTWTVQFSNRSNPEASAGSRLVNPPTVGTSEEYLWDHTGGVWTLHAFNYGYNNLGARLTAVPEPGSVVALGFGVVALLRRRRR